MALLERYKDDENQKMEETVSKLLREIGVPAHIKGYSYLRSAIMHLCNDRKYLNGITKKLYPCIANEFETTPSRVDRAMIHAVQTSFERNILVV